MAKSSNADDIVGRYIRRVSELSQRPQSLPSQGELESLALELGMSESDLKLAQAEARACRQRARTYKRVGRWKDAIAEFEGASLVPITSPEVLLDWAQAHKGRYIETRKKKHWDKAQQLARQCLEIKPGFRNAAHFLNDLDAIAPPPGGELLFKAQSVGMGAGKKLHRKLKSGSRRRQAIPLAIVIVGTAAISYLSANDRGPQTSSPPDLRPAITSAPPRSSASPQKGTVTIPAQIVPGEGGEGLTFEVRNSALTRYSPKSAYYKAQFILVNNTRQEISRATGQLEYLNSNGEIVDSKPVRMLSTSGMVLRPGDRHPVSVIDSQQRTPSLDQLASVRLRATHLTTTPAAENYPPTPAGKFTWSVAQPPGTEIQVGIRNQVVSSYGSISKSHYFKLTAEITNTGSVNLNKLKLQVDVFDDNNSSMGNRPLLVSHSTLPTLLRGETRLVHTTIAVPRSPHKYRLTVVEAETP